MSLNNFQDSWQNWNSFSSRTLVVNHSGPALRSKRQLLWDTRAIPHLRHPETKFSILAQVNIRSQIQRRRSFAMLVQYSLVLSWKQKTTDWMTYQIDHVNSDWTILTDGMFGTTQLHLSRSYCSSRRCARWLPESSVPLVPHNLLSSAGTERPWFHLAHVLTFLVQRLKTSLSVFLAISDIAKHSRQNQWRTVRKLVRQLELETVRVDGTRKLIL